MRTFTFQTGQAGSIADHVREFTFALLLASRIINRHFTRSEKIASWIDLQEDYFIAGFYSDDYMNNNGDNFSFSLSDGILTVTTKTAIAERMTTSLNEAQGPEKNWQQVLELIYVFGALLSEATPDNDQAHT